MAYWDLGMKHIVDVDGQLLAIDADVIDTTRLLEKANRPTDSHLAMILGRRAHPAPAPAVDPASCRRSSLL